MNLPATFAAINELRDAGVVERYALGGAVAANFYVEPAFTRDVDIFVALQAPTGFSLLTLEPIHDFFRARGCAIEGEGVIVAGWPVQFLPDDSPLAKEAIDQAIELDLDGTPVTVFTAEHLAAIALKLGRAKDKTRLVQLWQSRVLDERRFSEILERHQLDDAWLRFQAFLSE